MIKTGRIPPEQLYEQMSCFETEARDNGHIRIAGVDEAGRGPLAGPVVAAACILSPDCPILGVNDSKKLSPARREALYQAITQNALSYCVALIEPDEIDRINILQATIRAMRLAVSGLHLTPDLLLVDALNLPDVSMHVQAIIKGDAKSVSIAAASILAKVTRDRLMDAYDVLYPGYGFIRHKGYGTPEHYAAIDRLGITPIHRLTFLKKL